MATKKTKPERTPIEFTDDIVRAMRERDRKGLIKNRKDNTYPEGLRLIRRMPEFKLSLEKLKRFPKKEDAL